MLGYRPWLDGLRAIAIITVVGFHLERLQPIIRGSGAAGLDVFFVLSGFLITVLLLEERAKTGRISLPAFYMRRVRRLLPALALLLVGVIALAIMGVPELPVGKTLRDSFAVAFYFGNWVKALTTNRLGLVGHTWSLSVEEQFYLVWPLLLIALTRWNIVGRRLLVLLLATSAVSAIWWEVLKNGTEADGRRGYFGTDTRGYALLLGCAAAVLLHHGLQPNTAWWRQTRAVLAGAAALFLLVYFVRPGWLPVSIPFFLDLPTVATVILVVHLCSTPPNWGHAMLSVPPMVWIGRLSYGIYLFHFPVIELLTAKRTGLDGVALALLDIAVTLGLAIASWVLVERRFLKRRSITAPPYSAVPAP